MGPRLRIGVMLVVFAAAAVWSIEARAQAADALINPNSATDQQLRALPHLTPEIVKAIVAARPFSSMLDFNALLTKHGLGQTEREAFYARAFIPLDLNTASEAEFMTIPGVGKRMAHEFEEYRPWKSQAQFQKEIGKYVDQKEVARLWRYVVIR